MSRSTKFTLLSLLGFLVIFLIIWTIMNFSFQNIPGAYRAAISGGLTAFLAPRIQTTKQQSGKQKQLHWIFLKKPISI